LLADFAIPSLANSATVQKFVTYGSKAGCIELPGTGTQAGAVKEVRVELFPVVLRFKDNRHGLKVRRAGEGKLPT
jgi:hypothetical protein